METVHSFESEDGKTYVAEFQSCAPTKEQAATSSFIYWLKMLNSLGVDHSWSADG